MAVTLSYYQQLRPDLLVNWQRAHDPAWIAANPDSQGIVDYINKFGSLNDYLQADYGQSFSDTIKPRDAQTDTTFGETPIGVQIDAPTISTQGNSDFSNISSPSYDSQSNPFNTYGDTGENNYIPPGSYEGQPDGGGGDIGISSDGGFYVGPSSNTIGWPVVSTGNASAVNAGNDFPIANFPQGIPISTEPLQGGTGANGEIGGSGGGIFSGGLNNTIAFPLPVDPATAAAISIILSNGNIFGGGSGSPSDLLGQVENVVTDPVGTTGTALSNLGQNIFGPSNMSGYGQAATAGVIAFPSGGNSGGSGGSSSTGTVSQPSPVVGPPSSADQATSGTIAFPLPVEQPPPAPPPVVIPPVAPPVTPPPATQTDNGNQPTTVDILPSAPPPTPAPVPQNPPVYSPQTPTDNGNQPPSVAVTPGIFGGPSTPSTPQAPSDANQPPATGVIPNPTPSNPVPPISNPGVIIPPIITPAMPTDTTIPSPLDRNYYREGNQSSQDLASLYPQIAALYGQASGGQSQQDYTNLQNLLAQYGITNQNLSQIANQQTTAANTALRQSNLTDVSSMAGQAYGLQQQYNPGLYSSLSNFSQGANQQLSLAQQQQNAANFLSPQEMNTAQQTAREAWSARGLVNSPGAIGDEILNTDAALRARQQQAFANTNAALGNVGQSAALYSANQFNPFTTVASATTQNQGLNTNLFGQLSGLSSGAFGNQYAQQAYNPFNPYASDVYGSNFNAANARNIAAGNNAAAIQGANTANNAAIASGFLRFAGQYLSCWVARSCYGVDNPKWLMFRFWMLHRGPKWFAKFYVEHGAAFAAWLDNHPRFKPMVKSWMDRRIATLNPL